MTQMLREVENDADGRKDDVLIMVVVQYSRIYQGHYRAPDSAICLCFRSKAHLGAGRIMATATNHVMQFGTSTLYCRSLCVHD